MVDLHGAATRGNGHIIQYRELVFLQHGRENPSDTRLTHRPLEAGRTDVGNEQNEWNHPNQVQKNRRQAKHGTNNLSQTGPELKQNKPAVEFGPFSPGNRRSFLAVRLDAWN